MKQNLAFIKRALDVGTAYIYNERLIVDERSFILDLNHQNLDDLSDEVKELVYAVLNDKTKLQELVDILTKEIEQHFLDNVPQAEIEAIANAKKQLIAIAEKYNFVLHNNICKRKDEKGFYFVTFENEEYLEESDNGYLWNFKGCLYFGRVLNESGIDYEKFNLEIVTYDNGYYELKGLPVNYQKIKEGNYTRFEAPFWIIDRTPQLSKFIKEYNVEYKRNPTIKSVALTGIPFASLWGLMYGFAMDSKLFTYWWYYLLLILMALIFGYCMNKSMNRFPYYLNEKNNLKMAKRYSNMISKNKEEEKD